MKHAQILILMFGVLVNSTHAAQKPTAPDASLATEAGAAYDARDWAKAAALYEKISKQSPQSPHVFDCAWKPLFAPLGSMVKRLPPLTRRPRQAPGSSASMVKPQFTRRRSSPKKLSNFSNIYIQ